MNFNLAATFRGRHSTFCFPSPPLDSKPSSERLFSLLYSSIAGTSAIIDIIDDSTPDVR